MAASAVLYMYAYNVWADWCKEAIYCCDVPIKLQIYYCSKLSWNSAGVSILYSILYSCVNWEWRTSYRELSQGSRQKTKDSHMTDFSIILHWHNTTQPGLFAWATVCFNKIKTRPSKMDVSSCTSTYMLNPVYEIKAHWTGYLNKWMIF